MRIIKSLGFKSSIWVLVRFKKERIYKPFLMIYILHYRLSYLRYNASNFRTFVAEHFAVLQSNSCAKYLSFL